VASAGVVHAANGSSRRDGGASKFNSSTGAADGSVAPTLAFSKNQTFGSLTPYPYQFEAAEVAVNSNTIVHIETGKGKVAYYISVQLFISQKYPLIHL
jgi:hypothetical protein